MVDSSRSGSTRASVAAPAPIPGEDELRARLSLPPVGARALGERVVWDWLTPALVTLLALVLRVVNLGHPSRLIFDETYYVKQATSMLLLGYAGEWADGSNPAFEIGDYSGLSPTADYVVHPPLGPWLLALGQLIFGSDDPVGWRISAAVAGALGVLLVTLIVTRLLRSRLLGGLAGVLVAVDGAHLVLSRTGLLDVFLSTLVLAGLALVLLDQRWARARLARRVARARSTGDEHVWGPHLGVRWWLIAAGFVLGLSAGVKWSGLYAVAALGLLTFGLDVQARRAVGVRAWFGGSLLRSGLPQFVFLVGTAALGYLASWASWFASRDAYGRQWATQQRAAGHDVALGWLGPAGDALASLGHFHAQMYSFHRGLDSEHSYMSHPAGWILQWRPTSFYWPDPLPLDAHCEVQRCVQAITSVGNPAVWWLGALGLVVLLWAALRWGDARAWVIIAGFGATYLPWFFFTDRTIFTFYTVAISPYVAMTVAFALAWLLGVIRPRQRRGQTVPPGRIRTSARTRWLVVVAVAVLACALTVIFWPVWTGATIPYDAWFRRMWLPSWV